MKKSKFLKAIEVSRSVLYDFHFKCDSRVKSTSFSREKNSKLTFPETILFVLNLVTKSLQIELNDFLNLIKKDGSSISKQGFSQARKKIKPEAFRALFQTIVEWFYRENKPCLFMGFRLLAVDASILEIANTQKLIDAFGAATGSGKALARAKASAIYDVTNDFFVKGIITKYTDSERSIAEKLIDDYLRIRTNHDLFLFDRGYPSKDFFAYLLDKQVKFIIRTPKNYYLSKSQATVADQVFELKHKGQIMRLRAIRIPLDSGQEELIITNVFDETLDVPAFKALYFKRWSIETKFDVLKNKIQIEKFSGGTQQTIEQEFYAALFIANMASLMKDEADDVIADDQKDKDLKYEYKTNNNILIGTLKNNIVCLITEPSPRRRKKLYKKLLINVQRNRVPVRPGRQYERFQRSNANKHSFRQRSAV